MHHFLNMSQAQRVGHVPAHAREHDFQRVVKPLEDLGQRAVDQTLVEIKHGPDCRLCLTQTEPKLTLDTAVNRNMDQNSVTPSWYPTATSPRSDRRVVGSEASA